MLYVSPARIDFVVPANLGSGDFEVIVTSQDGYVSRGSAVVATVAPGLLTTGRDGTGTLIALNASTLQSGAFAYTTPESLASDKRTRLMLFATGIAGAGNVDLSNDVRAGGVSYVNLAESIAVEARTTDGRNFWLPVEYAGRQGRFAGVDQITVRLVPDLQNAGRVNLTIRVGGQTSNTASIMMR